MPKGDGTGPEGTGPKGKRLGPCRSVDQDKDNRRRGFGRCQSDNNGQRRRNRKQ